ncbi:DsbC family protein [Halomonadaceae bacterium KBTZ08]
MRSFSLASLLILVGLIPAVAQAASTEERIREQLSQRLPDMPIERVSETEREGLYEVKSGGNLLYITADGRYIFTGQMLRLDEESVVNLSEQARSKQRREAIAALDQDELIRFGPDKGSVKADLYVFTDTTCGYCRKLHRHMEALNELGIRVNYLAYPRGGPGSKGARKLEAVWCSEDRRSAMTRAKQGETVTAPSCDAPVVSHFRLGQSFGVKGTPALVTESGRMIRGYQPPQALARKLGIEG